MPRFVTLPLKDSDMMVAINPAHVISVYPDGIRSSVIICSAPVVHGNLPYHVEVQVVFGEVVSRLNDAMGVA